MLQAREKTNKRFHGAIPKLLHSIKHSRSKAAPSDDELHQVRIPPSITGTKVFFSTALASLFDRGYLPSDLCRSLTSRSL